MNRLFLLWLGQSAVSPKMKDMATSVSPAKVTFDEYLEQERAAKFKSEYRSGEVFAMAGGSPVHAELAMNIGFLLKKLSGCRVFSSDLKVYAQTSTREYDLGLKASFYRSIPSVKAIFLVDSERVYVQTQRRNGGAWMLHEFTDKEQVAWVADNSEFTVGDIYAGIDMAVPENAGAEGVVGSPIVL